MGLISPTIPQVNAPRDTQEVTTTNALTTIVSAINGGLDSANIADGGIQPVDLATAAKPATILGQFAGTPLNGYTTLDSFRPAGVVNWLCHGSFKQSGLSGGVGGGSMPVLEFGVGGFDVAGLTCRARVVGSVLVNDTAPACNFTFGLHGMANPSGGAGNIVITSLGLFGNSVAVNAPAANAGSQAASADFTLPGAGLYGLTVTMSGVIAANSVVSVHAALQVHWA